MGLSLNLLRIPKSEHYEDVENLASLIQNQLDSIFSESLPPELAKEKTYECVDLYKMYSDLFLIFGNIADPSEVDPDSMAFKVVAGNPIELNISDVNCVGYIPTHEIPLINQWIKENNVNNQQGYLELCENLSVEAKETLESFGWDFQENNCWGYVEELVEFYRLAELEENSVIAFVI